LQKFFYIVSLSILAACGNSTIEKKPEAIMEKEEIIPIIVDLQILESHFQRQFSRVDLYRDALDSSSASVFKQHGVSKGEFSSSLDYYAGIPDTLFTIYEAALDSIKFRMNQRSTISVETDTTTEETGESSTDINLSLIHI